jgi:hypothetical protein
MRLWHIWYVSGINMRRRTLNLDLMFSFFESQLNVGKKGYNSKSCMPPHSSPIGLGLKIPGMLNIIRVELLK